MPTRVQVYRQKLGQSAVGFRQIIVPVRFARAVTGAPQWDAPDPDDRGFALGNSPPSGSSGVRGPLTGVPVGKTVRLKVVREDIDATAPIFVTSNQERVVVTPTTALGADGVFRVRVTGGILNVAKIEARLGAATGPVLGEMLIEVMSLASIPVCAHFVTLNGTVVQNGGTDVPATTGRDRASVQALIRETNGIWQPVGVYFNVVEWRNTTASLTATHGNIAGSYQGCVGEDDSDSWAIQARQLMGINRRARAINIYFVRSIYNADQHTFDGTLGVGRTIVAGAISGLVMIDAADATTMAHEIGHVLNLDFHGGGGIGHADDVAGTDHARDHIWVRRRLLYSYALLSTTPGRRARVGYGESPYEGQMRGRCGAMLTFKNLPGDPTDAEYTEARNRAMSALP